MAPLFREPLRGDEQHPGTIGPHLTAPHTRHQPPSSRCYSYRQPPQARSRESRHFPATAPGRAVGGRLLSRVRRRVVGIGRLPSRQGGGFSGCPPVVSCYVQGQPDPASLPSQLGLQQRLLYRAAWIQTSFFRRRENTCARRACVIPKDCKARCVSAVGRA